MTLLVDPNRSSLMISIHDGQCGMCAHFGEHHAADSKLVQIRVKGQAPEGYVDACGHPQHAELHLKVAANSGCDGFTPANAA